MRQETRVCDGCKKRDIGKDGEVGVHLPRQPGEMDSGGDCFDFCHKCMATLVGRFIKCSETGAVVPTGEEFMRIIRNGDWKTMGIRTGGGK